MASMLAAVALALVPAAPARAAGSDACAPEHTLRWRGGHAFGSAALSAEF